MSATLIVAKNIIYVSDINCCCKTLMAATLIILAKLFATVLMPATCSNNFFATKCTFCSNFAFLATTFVAAKNNISCSYIKVSLLATERYSE
jgi:hypothetical protein